VSESIIMGIPMATGTGLFKIRHQIGNDGGMRGGDGQAREVAIKLPQRPEPLLAF
jgi:hypothetical protein